MHMPRSLIQFQVITGLTAHSRNMIVGGSSLPARPIEARMWEGRRRTRNLERFLVQIFSEEKPLVSEACPTQNLSSLGARLITERAWPPNSCVVVESPSGDLWARARVVYCQPVSCRTFGVGLEFFVLTGELAMRV